MPDKVHRGEGSIHLTGDIMYQQLVGERFVFRQVGPGARDVHLVKDPFAGQGLQLFFEVALDEQVAALAHDDGAPRFHQSS